MSFTNFAALQSLTSVGDTDQMLVSLDNGLSGAAGFGRVTTVALEKSLDVYTTVQSNSAQWAADSTTDTGVRALTANWQSTYTTVSSQSANWIQTLSFNSSNAQLSISNGNTISLSALSASGIDASVRSLTANWQSTYSTVSSQSANWQSTYSTVGSNSAAWGNSLTIFRQVSSIVSPNSATSVHALSVISLSANVDFAIVAKGTGATLAQIPNLSASGGNKRGQYATDFQKQRFTAARVASGNYSVIAGGRENTASGSDSVVCGGSTNTASNFYSTIGGGSSNTASNLYSTIGGGYANQASGEWSTIGGGTTNRTTGPACTVAGGNLNQATDSYSTIGGGIGNYSTGQYATVAGGFGNYSTGIYATVAGGGSNYANGVFSTIAGGYQGRADRNGQYAYSTSLFAEPGDGQHVQYVLYGTSVDTNSVVLTYNNTSPVPGDASISSLLIPGQSMLGIFTIQIIGFDENDNVSQGLAKVVIKKTAAESVANESIVANTTLGTHTSGAGSFQFVIDTSTTPEHIFTIVCSSNSLDITRWVAHVSGTWVYQPPAYP